MTEILGENASLKGLGIFKDDFIPKMLDYLNFYPKEDRQHLLDGWIDHWKNKRVFWISYFDKITEPVSSSEPDCKVVLHSKIRQIKEQYNIAWREKDEESWHNYCDEKIKHLKMLLKVA